jgi:hypothetical protein
VSGAGKKIKQSNFNLYTGGVISGFLAGWLEQGEPLEGLR